MKFKIDKKESNLYIIIEEITNKQQRNNLFNSFLLCKKGDCDCPTGEYKKVEDFRIKPGTGKLELIVTPKENEELNPEEVVKCIKYNMDRFK